MPTLADKLKQNTGKGLLRGAGGILSEETPEQLQTLSGQAGLSAPPITAIGASALGATPDQLKMVGTPAQKTAALTLAQQPVDSSLANALRRGPVRNEATTQEKQQSQKSQDMQNLGSLGDRVNQFVEIQRQKLEQQAVAGSPVEVQAATSFQNKDISSIKQLLSQYRANPTNQQVLLQLNQALGYDTSRQLSPQEVDQLYESTVNSIARGGAGSVDDDLNVDDLIQLQEFGYDKDTLSSLLGVSSDLLGKMTVGDLRNQINKVAEQEFNTVQTLEQQAVSGQLGQAERDLARQGTREASRVGVRSTEADVASLEQQIANADQVQFAGRTYKVDDLLKDETISELITEYMNSAPESELRNAVDSSEPALKQFIEKNAALLADASAQMKQGAQTFQDTQLYNKSLASVPFGGMSLTPDIAKQIIPGYGSLQASRIDVNSVPVLRLATEKGAEYGRNLANNLNTEYQNDKEVGKEIQQMDYNTLQSWDIGGGPDSQWQVNYIQPKRVWEEISRTPPEQRDALISKAVTDATSSAEAQERLSANRAINVLFGASSSVNGGLIDSNGDGIVDSGEQIKQALLQANPKPSLLGGPSAVRKYEPTAIGQPTLPKPGVDEALYAKLGKAALGGAVDADELTAANLNIDEAVRLQELNGKNNVNPEAVENIWGQVRNEHTSNQIDQLAKSVTDPASQIEQLKEIMGREKDSRINRQMVEGRISELLKGEIAQKAMDIIGTWKVRGPNSHIGNMDVWADTGKTKLDRNKITELLYNELRGYLGGSNSMGSGFLRGPIQTEVNKLLQGE